MMKKKARVMHPILAGSALTKSSLVTICKSTPKLKFLTQLQSNISEDIHVFRSRNVQCRIFT